jgi:uncharacterized protein (DUF58 family)
MRLQNANGSLRLNSPLVPALSAVLLILLLVDPYKGWTVLFVVFGGSFLISYIWARSLAGGLSLKREMRFGWAQVGDQLEERFTLVNRSRFPALWVEILDETNMPNYWANQVRGINAEAESRWLVRSVCSQRGLYTFGPTTLRTQDLLGFFTVTLHDPTSTTMMVMPPVVTLPSIQVAPGGRAGEGTPRLNAPEQTVSSASVREYQPGDSLRWIHWPSSARRDELIVRVFEGAPAGDWWIVLDLERGVQVGSGLESTVEHGVILAASLANLGMRSGRSVGLITHGQELVWLPPNMSDEHNWSILRALALIEPGEQDLKSLLDLARPGLSQNTSLIVITPAVAGDWLEALLAIRRQQIVPTVLLFDPQSFGEEVSPKGMAETLAQLGIVHEVISKDLLDRDEIQPGRMGHWQWRITPLGRAVPDMDPEAMTWRGLA